MGYMGPKVVAVADRQRSEKYVAAAMAVARDELQVLKRRKPTGIEIVFAVTKMAVDVQRRCKVRTIRPAGYRSSWGDCLHTADEVAEADKQRRIDRAAGDYMEPLLAPTPKEISTADAVYELFMPCIVGRTPEIKRRDWKLLVALAHPKASLRTVGRDLHISKDMVADGRDRTCGAIWKRMHHLMPPAPIEMEFSEAA